MVNNNNFFLQNNDIILLFINLFNKYLSYILTPLAKISGSVPEYIGLYLGGKGAGGGGWVRIKKLGTTALSIALHSVAAYVAPLLRWI
jgi:hypothetical protein